MNLQFIPQVQFPAGHEQRWLNSPQEGKLENPHRHPGRDEEVKKQKKKGCFKFLMYSCPTGLNVFMIKLCLRVMDDKVSETWIQINMR